MKGFVAGGVAGAEVFLVTGVVGNHIFYNESGLICVGRDTELIELDPEADGDAGGPYDDPAAGTLKFYTG